MSASYIITAIVVVLLFSLVFSAISYNRQLAIKRIQTQIRQCRKQADENLALQNLLLNLDPDYQLITLLQKHILHDLQNAASLAPQDASLTSQLTRQKNLYSRYQNAERDNEIREHVNTDAELSQTQFQLNQISKWIDIQKNKGSLPASKAREFGDHIKYLKLDIDISTHLHQAREHGKSNDISMYQLHIKLARDILKKTPLEVEDKTKRIKELTDILNEVKRTNKVVPESNLPESNLSETNLSERNDGETHADPVTE